MQEICQSGSEGGGAGNRSPYPYYIENPFPLRPASSVGATCYFCRRRETPAASSHTPHRPSFLRIPPLRRPCPSICTLFLHMIRPSESISTSPSRKSDPSFDSTASQTSLTLAHPPSPCRLSTAQSLNTLFGVIGSRPRFRSTPRLFPALSRMKTACAADIRANALLTVPKASSTIRSLPTCTLSPSCKDNVF
jgi:hypothetical protein